MKLLNISTIGVVLISSVVLGGAVFAEESGSREINTQIMFDENTDPVNPVDPIDPEKPVEPIDPIDPEKPINPGTGGPLGLDYASSLSFGKQKIVSTDQEYFAKVQSVNNKDGKKSREVPLYAQVTDNRGTLQGWTLSVKQNSQFKAGNKELIGAKIDFLNGQLATTSESPIPSLVKEKFDVTGDGTGASTDVMSAKDTEGSGTYIYRFGDDKTKAESVKISIPGKTVKIKDVAYTTTLTWTMNDIPSNGSGGEEGGGEETDTGSEALNKVFARAKNLDPENYTPETWKGVLAGISNAGKVLTNSNATDADKREAAKQLNDAINALVEV